MKILVFGELLWDIIDNKKFIGGAPFNFAAHAAQCGADVALVSRVGNDELGRNALKISNTFGINTQFIGMDRERPTGIVLVQVSNGQPTYEIVKNKAYDFIALDKKAFKKIEQYNIFYFGSLAQRSEISKKTVYDILDKNQFDHIFLDINLRKDCYSIESVEQSISRCTILKLSDEELTMISLMLYKKELSEPYIVESITNTFSNIKLIIVTKGSKGCTIYEDKEVISVNGIPTNVKDTIGAGDAFSATFLTTYYKTKNTLLSATLANQVGAFVASNSAAVPKYSQGLHNQIYSIQKQE